MSTENMQEIRNGLIESYRSAETVEQKESIKAQMMETLNEREKAFFGDYVAMAGRIAHIDRTQKALDAKRAETVGIAQVLGFPIGEKVASGNYTVYLTDTVNKLDSESLAGLCEEDTEIAGLVDTAIEEKRQKITIATITLSDLKSIFGKHGKTVPTKKVKEVRCKAEPVKKA